MSSHQKCGIFRTPSIQASSPRWSPRWPTVVGRRGWRGRWEFDSQVFYHLNQVQRYTWQHRFLRVKDRVRTTTTTTSPHHHTNHRTPQPQQQRHNQQPQPQTQPQPQPAAKKYHATQRGRDHARESFACSAGSFVASVSERTWFGLERMSSRFPLVRKRNCSGHLHSNMLGRLNRNK